ncbi:hypothetical protein ONZ45_g14814 [Pleurotus djamor]|nr:hypothetical protein ONZ45_g14983 [Pleurotus djamor]KAJ8482834.1 hypothetical protein ONZ45_g14814 [Pleurotus djamor]
MSTSLSSWYQEHATQLFRVPQAGEEDDLVAAFDATFSSAVQTTLNGEDISREKLFENIKLIRASSIHIDVAFGNIIEAPLKQDEPSTAGLIAGQVVITRSLKIRIRVTPAQNETIAVFQVLIEEDPNVTSEDRRRVMKLSEVLTHRQLPVHLGPTLHATAESN